MGEKKASPIGCRTWAILIVLVIVGLTLLVGFVASRLISLRMNTAHSYTLPSPPRFLTDALASTKATQAIASEGYSTNVWKPVELNKTSDPDGNRDKCLLRDPTNPAKGDVTFCDSDQASAKNSRVVHVELKGNQVECRVEMPR